MCEKAVVLSYGAPDQHGIAGHGGTGSLTDQFMLRPFRADVAFCRDFTRAFSPGWYVRALQALFESAISSPERAQHTSLG